MLKHKRKKRTFIKKSYVCFSKLLLKGHIIKIFVVTDWHVDAAHMEFAMTFSNLKLNLVDTYENNFQCTVRKSLHPLHQNLPASLDLGMAPLVGEDCEQPVYLVSNPKRRTHYCIPRGSGLKYIVLFFNFPWNI